MASHTESELKALKVADLKELCTARLLPTTGRKDELIARLLETDNSSATAAPVEESTEVNYDDDEPAAAESVAVAPTSTEDPAAAEPPTATTSEAAVTDAPATSEAPAPINDAGTKAVESEAADAKAKADADEIERQKRRAARFGIPYVEKAQPTPPKPRTGAKPPSTSAPAAKKGPAERKGVPDKPKSGTTTPKPAPAPKVVDPAEEERKRKRAERFGLPVGGASEEKKQKV